MPTVSAQLVPYYKGWSLLSSRRQFNESGAQATPLTEVISVGKLLIGEDPDDLFDFCKVLAEAEGFELSHLADTRKAAILALRNKK
jgi:hypothetical protein